METIKTPEEFLDYQQALLQKTDSAKRTLVICSGPGCLACKCKEILTSFKEAITRKNLEDQLTILETGCHGFCQQGTIVLIGPENIFYCKVKPKDVEKIIDKTILNGEIIENLLYEDPQTKQTIAYEKDIPFYSKQHRILMGNANKINPTRIDDYIAVAGYAALIRAFSMAPEEIIAAVKQSELRGRGGGGFSVGIKWESCRNAHGTPKYVICNADEGDPGAFMDRSLLEGNPHSVIEGMIIGAYAIGANTGFIYVRNEYPIACIHANFALEQARKFGFLGKNILGSGFDFDMTIVRGAGAFVCGESTALMASLEGKVGEPRAKYIHTVEHGYKNLPSNLNNVESWANIPVIINKGVDAYTKVGIAKNRGTKIFSLVGKINNTGLVEVPLGTTLREIIFDIGGGIPGGKKFKAVQTGGPSGGCLPEKYLDESVDFDTLWNLGSMMGSGGMIIMDEDTCMVDVARYFINFLIEESCGKCLPCREGLAQMLTILQRICDGEGKDTDIQTLEALSKVMTGASLCALGTSAPFPVLSTIKYFREEYESHIHDKKCAGAVCKALVQYKIIAETCTGCHSCFKVCPAEAITGVKDELHLIDPSKCIKCNLCYEICNKDAIIKT